MIEDADIDPAIVRAFAEHMAKVSNATIGRTPEIIQTGLRLVGMQPEMYATTMGSHIFFPIDLGVATPEWSPWSQITVMAHECQHVIDNASRSFVAKGWDYLTSPARRTEHENRAHAAQLELEMWRRGEVAQWWPGVKAAALKSYHVTEADILVAERYLRVLAPVVRRGGFVSVAGREAVAWLDANAPELRHPSVKAR